MEHDFWHERWENDQIAFHEGRPNVLLEHHFDALNLSSGDKIFLPLCGKTVDIHWLMAQGLEVVGAELSEIAIKQLFVDVGMTPEVTESGPFKVYSAPQLTVFVGDIFHLTADMLGPVAAVYDRAALVALPEDMRAKYSPHLVSMTNTAPQLLITFDYDQSQMPGPPFAVPETAVRALYGDAYTVDLLESVSVVGGLKKKTTATELIWKLS
ncbi:MAG: thiopurine S-methyltransferase [Ponticaulis sp.]|nr:thiopurine S-methyltransferase [Ponticaulis sp.]